MVTERIYGRKIHHPERQDAYGTSVISIQINKSADFLSIKNRYNHTVNNPDQTFHSNPDEIIPGLSASLKAYFNVDWQQTAAIPDGFILMNGQILKVNFEINNRYLGDGFYTDNENIVNIDKTKQVQIDYFIWDTQTKQFGDNFLFHNKMLTTLDTPNLESVGNSFLYQNKTLTTLNAPNLRVYGDDFLKKHPARAKISYHNQRKPRKKR